MTYVHIVLIGPTINIKELSPRLVDLRTYEQTYNIIGVLTLSIYVLHQLFRCVIVSLLEELTISNKRRHIGNKVVNT